MIGIFAPSVPLNTDDNNANTSFRVVVKPTGGGNGLVRVTVTTAVGTSLTVRNVGVGVWNGSNSFTIAPPIELLFGGVSGFIGLPGGQSIVSDLGNLAFGGADRLVVIVDDGSPGGNRFSSGNSNADTWFLTGGASFNQSSPGGYTLLSGIDYMLSLVETNDPTSNALQGYQPKVVM